ncbi:MAG: BTAD domain-containing putative transcriptional regulator [Coriobacteriales bacterium]
MTAPGAAVGPAGFVLARFAGATVMNRDRLISMMLQDRGVLRLISAPHGYGKSFLAYEYAQRLFARAQVVWIDGSSPEFLQALDSGDILPLGMPQVETGGLLVIDELPALDEKRMETCSDGIDRLLYQGVEVVVTTLPSCDFLRNAQPDRVLIAAGDLLVTERDVRTCSMGASEEERLAAVECWHAASESLFGSAPCSIWPEGAGFSADFLAGFFEEKLPLELIEAAFAMLLLGKGSFGDLERLDVALRPEYELMVAKDYVFLGVDPVLREFSVGSVPFEELQMAVVRAGRADALFRCSCPIHEKVLGLLLERAEADRAGKIMDVFCADDHCESWLRDCGWELLDRGEMRLLEELFRRCREGTLDRDPKLMAVRSWMSGLLGDGRESAYYARRAMGAFDAVCCDEEEHANGARLMAYLALVAFSQGAPLVCAKGRFAPEELGAPVDFLAAVVDICEEDELMRAFGVLEGNLAPASKPRRSERVSSPSPQREDELEALLTGSCERFSGSPAFRLALHLAACIDSVRVKGVVHELGCGMLISMRKHGINCFTQSVLVSDLWRSGFFGVNTRSADARDAKLMNTAGSFLMKLTMLSGGEPASIPWEAGAPSLSSTALPKKPASKRKSSGKSAAERVPIVNVSLFGGLEVIIGERYIPETKWSHRALQLFSILILYQGRDVSRETIFAQLWPQLPRKRALDNFYNAWSRIQALLGEGPYLSRRGEFCCINSRFVHSDVAEFDQLSRRLLTERDETSTLLDIYARMEAIYRGGLLPSEQGNEFIDVQRERYRAMYVDSMITASQRSLEIKDSRLALWFARKAIEEDQRREDVYVALVKAQVAAGQRCSAIRTFFQCQSFLRDELGLDPSMELQGLYRQLIASDPSLLKLNPGTFSL